MTAIAGFKSIQSSNQSNQAKRRGNDPEFNTISDLASQLLYLKINEKSISKAVKLEEDYDALVKKVNDCVSAFTQKMPSEKVLSTALAASKKLEEAKMQKSVLSNYIKGHNSNQVTLDTPEFEKLCADLQISLTEADKTLKKAENLATKEVKLKEKLSKTFIDGNPALEILEKYRKENNADWKQAVNYMWSLEKSGHRITIKR